MSYEIKKLLPRHIKIMDLKILGLKQKEIARELDLSEQAVSSIVRSKVFQEHLPQRRRELAQVSDSDEGYEPTSVLSRLHRSALPSATRLVELLGSDDERIALAAARAILDRAGYGAVKGEYNMKTTVFVQGGQLSMDQGKLKGTNDCGESTEWADPAVDGSEDAS